MSAPLIKIRKLTVYRKAFPRQDTCNRYVFFPQILLQGKWLEDNGFVCGQTVEVSYEQGKVIITLPDTEHTCSNDAT